MINYKLVSVALESKQPVWCTLNQIYNSAEGDVSAKTLEVTELVGKFVLYWLLTNQPNLADIETTRKEAGKIISRINECYPFDVNICMANVMRGINTYTRLSVGPKPLEEVDDLLSLLMKGNVVDSVAPATESLKDKVVDKLKTMFHLGDKKEKSKDDKDPKKKPDAKKDSKPVEKDKASKLDASKEDGVEEPDEQPVEPTDDPVDQTEPEMVLDKEEETLPPSDGEEVPNTNARVDAHKVAWEVLHCLMREGGIHAVH